MAQLGNTVVTGALRVVGDTYTSNLSSTLQKNVLIGTGTAATTSGSNYIPAKWTFNLGIIPADGDMITIKIPVAGHDYGVFLSLNNGTNYYPIARQSTARLTSHFPVGEIITLAFKSTGSVADVYAVAGSAARTTVSNGAWIVVNFYDTNNTYNFSGSAFTSGNSGTATHNANDPTTNAVLYYNANGPTTALGAQSTDGGLYVQGHNSNWLGEIAQDYRDGDLFTRGKNNGTWTNWRKVAYAEDCMGMKSVAYNAFFYPDTKKILVNKSTTAWDAQVCSYDGYNDNIYLTFKPSATNMALMIGLNNDISSAIASHYQYLDYCWYCMNNGKANIYESNTTNKITDITYAAGDEFRIEYSNSYIKYYHNGSLKRAVLRPVSSPATKLYFDSSFHGATAAVYDVNFGPLTYDAVTVNGLKLTLVT